MFYLAPSPLQVVLGLYCVRMFVMLFFARPSTPDLSYETNYLAMAKIHQNVFLCNYEKVITDFECQFTPRKLKGTMHPFILPKYVELQ